jgi:arylesterase / paraoxonase
MGRILRILGIGFVVLILVGGVLLYRAFNTAGYFATVASSFAGKCEAVQGAIGAEDIELDRATGNLFISSQDRRTVRQGGIYLAKIEHPEIAPRWITAPLAMPLHPHGLSLFADAAGRKTLAVINHPGKGADQILLFDVTDSADGATLTLRRTVEDPLLRNLNDVTLVSHEAFYATNDHGSETAFGEQLENWLMLPRSTVTYYDGTAAAIAATGFNYANGINRNADASEIYVAETTGRNLSTFRRNATTGALAHIHDLFIPMGLDNIDVDAEGNLWVGAHPRLLDFVAHAQDAAKRSPSAVVKVTPAGDASTFETIYVNTGEEISGSSVAVRHEGRLVIGSVFEPQILNCTLN